MSSMNLELEQSRVRKITRVLTWWFVSLLHALTGPDGLHFFLKMVNRSKHCHLFLGVRNSVLLKMFSLQSLVGCAVV